ncbi:DUF6010 family protein [Actinocorallia longicatena]|uniref:Uncharacterized protein n=1 Tax=Actinocorallia longicatena TaxID=111803 RepID=A0ABP6QKR2_9ACTN
MTTPPIEADRWLTTPQAVAAGLAGAAAHLALIALLPHGRAVQAVALGVALCYGIYLGFAMTRGTPPELLIELAFVCAGVALACLGLWHDPRWLALAWALHGGWDLLHHRDHHVLGTRGVPRWYVPACAAFDFPVALSILLVL